MNIQFDIQPRQTGKTTSLARLALSVDNGIFLTVKDSNTKTLIDRYDFEHSNVSVMSSRYFINEYFSYSGNFEKDYECDNIYIDDYLFFREQDQRELNHIISNFNKCNVYIKSTAKNIIFKDIFDMIKLIRCKNINYSELQIHNIQLADYLYHNLLTHPDCRLSLINCYKNFGFVEEGELFG